MPLHALLYRRQSEPQTIEIDFDGSVYAVRVRRHLSNSGRSCLCYFWQDGHQKTFRPSSSAVRIVVPHTRHGSPARRYT